MPIQTLPLNLHHGYPLNFTIPQSSDYTLETMNRGTIIKFDGNIEVPSEFDMTHLIGQFKGMISQEISSKMSDGEAEVFVNFFEICNPKIPIISQFDTGDVISLIESENLLVQYPDIEDYAIDEVTILARIISNNPSTSEKPIFDPLKDFIKMNREMLRQFAKERPDGMKEIFHNTNYRKLEIIAIYQ